MTPQHTNRITRRESLRIGALTAMGLTLPRYFALAEEKKKHEATADAVIFVNLAGGPSHLDTLDMKPEAPVETRGEFRSIASKLTGLRVCEHLPKFAAVADQFTLIRGISHNAGAHPQGQSWISTGNRPTPALKFPSLGSVVSRESSSKPDLPSYVAIPKTEWNAGYLGDAFNPFNTNAVPRPDTPFQVRGISLADGVSLSDVRRRRELLEKVNQRFREAESQSQLLEALDKFGKQAHEMITSKRAQAAFDVSREPQSIQKLFAKDELSQSLLLSCRLVEYGVRFVTVTNAGWDTHLDNFRGHKRLLGPLDAALPAMLELLRAKQLLKRTLVVVMGEFGRTPRINENAGRDHYPRTNWCLMTGGGVKPGRLIGGTNKSGTAPNDATNLSPDDIAATIYRTLGIDARKEYLTNSNRPTMLVPEGRAILGLFD